MNVADRISVLSELERVGYVFEYSGDQEVKGRCPFHEDDTPSCSINLKRGLFTCYACGKGGDVVTFLAGLLKVDRGTILVDLAKRYDLENVKTIEPSVIERYHERIWSAGALLKELRDRAVTDEDIRKYRLGEDRGRITIPIKNMFGMFVNVRRYMPGAPGAEKMRNTRGRGKDARPFPIEQLNHETVVVCGGEIKAIVAARILNPHGIGAITCTAGENVWPSKFIEQFAGKRAYVCLDVDEPGRKAAQELALRLSTSASWIGVVDLSIELDTDACPKGDVNDYVAQGYDLHARILDTLEWKPEFKKPVWDDESDDPIEVSLSQTVEPANTHKRLRFAAMVAASGRSPYVIPKEVHAKCDRSQQVCPMCPLFAHPNDQGVASVVVPREGRGILELVASSKRAMSSALKTAFDVPESCGVVTFEPQSYYSAELVRVNPSMDIANRDTDRTMLSAVAVECQATLNESYEFTGRMHPHPGSQEATLVLGDSEPLSDALDAYELDDPDSLTIFRPDEWTEEALHAKLDEVYDDLETNVTRIYQRRRMHLIVDLAYHSPLLIDFDGTRRIKGWVEVLVVGDSSQGKTETATRLMEHYRAGTKVECKNATVAGLLGGLAKFGDAWMVTWGVIPTHDKRLVILEELKGASIHTISKLTDMRSSGVAELPKIEKRRKHARTRLVALSNPRSDRPVASYGFGIETVLELIGNPEDVRRFDAALVLSARDVDVSVVNAAQVSRPHVEHRFTSDLCKELVLWSWTRTNDQVLFDEDAERFILREASSLSDSFTDRVPIVDRGSMRYKLARLSAALAARTFSSDEEGDALIVRRCHAAYVSKTLRSMYGDETHGYGRLSHTLSKSMSLTDPEAVQHALLNSPFPLDLCENMLYTDDITVTDLQDWTSFDRFEAQGLLSVLVRKRAIVKHDRSYRKNPDFVSLLRRLVESGAAASIRPDHIPEERF